MVFVIILSTGCTKKVELSAEEFKSRMEKDGYTVQEATSQFSQYDYIKKVYIAQNKDKTYQIEFYAMSNEESAESFYAHNKSVFENVSSASRTTVNLGNYSKYSQTGGGMYSVISRIGKTAIYVNANKDYKDEIKSVLDKLDY